MPSRLLSAAVALARGAAAITAVILALPIPIGAQTAPSLSAARWVSESALAFNTVAPAGTFLRVERSDDLLAWTAVQTLRSSGTNAVTNFAPASASARFYRANVVTDPAPFTGDHLSTSAGDVIIHPVNHASLVLRWGERTIYVDPVGGASPYLGLPRADLVVVTHSHSDHFDAATLNAVGGTNAIILAPQAVYSGLSAALKARTGVLTNGVTTNVLGLAVSAVPAYNGNHPKGTGNGYVLEIGGRRLFVSGDTGDVPEIRALTGIDIAFLCMNVPFTMTVAQASSVIRAFQPRVVYPYHYRNSDSTFSDLNALRRQVGTDLDIEVRLRKWY